ncbi:MAG: M50 family metallopeptidase [Lachnospiraceae bacterium]|nr:M50 family metallopeptidase [Lachnospiraceae bacterium]
MNYTLLLHSLISVLIILLLGICLGFFFSFLRNFAAKHNPLGANLINYITFVGVMHHELSHALLAFLSGAKVTEIKLFRIHHKDGALGYVAYAPRGNFILQSIQKVATSIAPIICGFISSYLLWLYVRPVAMENIWSICLFYYVLVSIILHMSLSKQDIKVMKGGLLVVIALMTILFYFLKLDLLTLM